MRLRKIWAFLLLITLVINPASLATASLDSSISEMFNRWGGRVNVTSPGAYEAQTRGFMVGGSLSARMPQDSMQLMSIKAPSISAGCGGIDIFGGAFSFVNADQFVQFAKKVGQNALGYAFSLGLEAVCPTCNSVIKDLRNVMNMINKGNVDSCMAAKALVNSAASGAGLASMEKCKGAKSAGGDRVTGWLECASGTEGEIRQKLRANALMNDSQAKNEGTLGNEVGSTTPTALANSGLTNDQRQLVVSIMGSWTTAEARDDCKYTAPTLKLSDLVEGGDLKMLRKSKGGFGDGEVCEDLVVETVSTIGFAGNARATMKGILAKYKAKTPLTPEEITFVNAVPIPPVAYMIKNSLAYSEQLSNALIDLTSEIVGAMQAWQAIENYVQLFEQGKTEVGELCGVTAKDFQEQIRDVRASRQSLFEVYMRGLDAQANTMRFMASIDAKVAATASHAIIAGLTPNFK